jgi:hypothetical protein
MSLIRGLLGLMTDRHVHHKLALGPYDSHAYTEGRQAGRQADRQRGERGAPPEACIYLPTTEAKGNSERERERERDKQLTCSKQGKVSLVSVIRQQYFSLENLQHDWNIFKCRNITIGLIYIRFRPIKPYDGGQGLTTANCEIYQVPVYFRSR